MSAADGECVSPGQTACAPGAVALCVPAAPCLHPTCHSKTALRSCRTAFDCAQNRLTGRTCTPSHYAKQAGLAARLTIVWFLALCIHIINGERPNTMLHTLRMSLPSLTDQGHRTHGLVAFHFLYLCLKSRTHKLSRIQALLDVLEVLFGCKHKSQSALVTSMVWKVNRHIQEAKASIQQPLPANAVTCITLIHWCATQGRSVCATYFLEQLNPAKQHEPVPA